MSSVINSVEFVIYRITCRITGKSYFGITSCTLARRWKQHCNDAFSLKRGHYLHRAMKKHGLDNFFIEEITTAVNLREAVAIERGLIAQYGTMVPNGYNLTSGGEGSEGLSLSKETRKKISEKHMGKKLSEETKLAISRGSKGKKNSPESIEKMRAAKLGKSNMTPEGKERLRQYRLGRRWTPEARAKASASKKGKPWTEAQRAAILPAIQTPEYRENMSKIVRARFGGDKNE